MSDNTLFLNPLVQAYTSNAPDPFYSRYSDDFNPTAIFDIDQKSIRSISLDLADVYVFTPVDLELDNGVVIVAKVIGAARIKTTGVDSDLSTPTVGYLPTYGTETLPGYVLLSTFNITAFEILGQADGTTVELFYGSKEDIVASNIGLVTQASRSFSSSLSLTNATGANVTSGIILDAGSYEVRGAVAYLTGGAVLTGLAAAISTTSATLPASTTIGVPSSSGEIKVDFGWTTATTVTEMMITIPTYVLVVPVNTTATLYLVAYATFGSSTVVANGWIESRKVL